MTALDRQVEIEILNVLSDFIPRNQTDITKAIGKSCHRSTDRVKVHRAIRRNAKFFKRSIHESEDSGKVWVLKKEIETVKHIVEEYPELYSRFQSSEIVLKMLIDKHVYQVCTDEWLSKEQELEFKNRLKISDTFFMLYLSEPPPKLLTTMETLFSITELGQEFDRRNRGETTQSPKPPEGLVTKYGFLAFKPTFNDMLDVTFRACVGADILYHREYGAGIEFLKKLKNSGPWVNEKNCL